MDMDRRDVGTVRQIGPTPLAGRGHNSAEAGRLTPCHYPTVRYTLDVCDAGWSSLVARRAHNPKVAGSNPAPATTRRPRHCLGLLLHGLASPGHRKGRLKPF